MGKPNSSPEFSELSRIEEELLAAKLRAARKAITHSGEKGRSLESEVASFLRSFLPAEYGISTGFVVYHTEDGTKLSPQLDIIIYDAIRTGPITKLSTCDVFPLEAVYGYIEVKASIQSSSDTAEKPAENSIEKCLSQNKLIRGMSERKYWVWGGGSPIGINLVPEKWLSLRSYVFAFEAQGRVARNADSFAKRMASVSKQLGPPTHIHGVFVANHGYFSTQAIDPRTAKDEDYYHVKYTQQHALTVFKMSLLSALASFRRFPDNWAPAIDQYYQVAPDWHEVIPEG
jgi:hypothetical protein